MNNFIKSAASFLTRHQLCEIAHVNRFTRDLINEETRAHPWSISPFMDALDRSSLTMVARFDINDMMKRVFHEPSVMELGDMDSLTTILACACRNDDLDLLKRIIENTRQTSCCMDHIAYSRAYVKSLLFLSMPTRFSEWECKIGCEAVPAIYTYYQNRTSSAHILQYLVTEYGECFAKCFSNVETNIVKYLHFCATFTCNTKLAHFLDNVQGVSSCDRIYVNADAPFYMHCMDIDLIALANNYNVDRFQVLITERLYSTMSTLGLCARCTGSDIKCSYLTNAFHLLVGCHREDMARSCLLARNFIGHEYVIMFGQCVAIQDSSLVQTIRFIANIMLEDDTVIPEVLKQSIMRFLMQHANFHTIPFKTLKRVLDDEQIRAFGSILMSVLSDNVLLIDPDYEVIYDECDKHTFVIEQESEDSHRDYTRAGSIHLCPRNNGLFSARYLLADALRYLMDACSQGYIAHSHIRVCILAHLYQKQQDRVCYTLQETERKEYSDMAHKCMQIIRAKRIRLDHLSARDRFMLGVALSNTQMINESGYALDMRKLIDQRIFDMLLRIGIVRIGASMIAYICVTNTTMKIFEKLDYGTCRKLFDELRTSDLRKIISASLHGQDFYDSHEIFAALDMDEPVGQYGASYNRVDVGDCAQDVIDAREVYHVQRRR